MATKALSETTTGPIVTDTWQRSFEYLTPTARALLRLLGRLAAEPIPVEMLTAGETTLAEAVERLGRVIELAELVGIRVPTSNPSGLLSFYFEAEPLLRRAREIGDAACGPDHSTIDVQLNSLALLLRVTNRLAEAEPLSCRALEIEEDPASWHEM